MSKYDEMLQKSGAKVGEGLQALGTIAASAGNEMALEQGHKELTASTRAPLHPGHNATLDMLGGANFIKDGMM